MSSDKKKHRRKVKTHWQKKRRRAQRALRRRGR
ncbi:MAG: AURKAIP1/COX24 domain-containing protein [Armatimonadota bacterium]|nr:AURKAIP1/COX24 domain-containing protein [Armatimonadota bacterium]